MTTEIKQALEERLKTITNDLSQIAVYHAPSDDWEAIPDPTELTEADENSEADAVEDWNERRSTLAALETEYRNVKRALAKIANGTYGYCEVSGAPIEANRLAANPAARTCVKHMDEESTLPN